MSTTMFKGARYLVKFDGEWSADNAYEAIVAVKHNAYTYLSKQPVPVGVQIDNTDFWLCWADPNAQMEELRQLVLQYKDAADQAAIDATNAINLIGDGFSSPDNTVTDFANDAAQRIEDLESKFEDTELAHIETIHDKVNNLVGFVCKIPRAYYSLRFCAGNGRQAGVTPADYVNGYAIELIESGLLTGWDAVFNCALDGLKMINAGVVQDVTSGSVGTDHCVVYFNSAGDMFYTNDSSITASALQAQGYYNAFEAYNPIMWGGIFVGRSEADMPDTSIRFKEYGERLIIGCDSDYWYIFEFIARTPGQQKSTIDDVNAFMQSKYPNVNSMLCDGGGSVQFYVVSSKENLFHLTDEMKPLYARDRKEFMGFSRKVI